MDGRDLFITFPETHTMGQSLERYVSQRVHQAIRDAEWQEILVTGTLERNTPAQLASWEKLDRPFNFQRPTVTKIDHTTIRLNCFPSRNLIQHYASVVASYLALKGRSTNPVRSLMPPDSEPLQTLLKSNLRSLEKTDVIILGEVHKLTNLPPGAWWTPAGQSAPGLFAWKKFSSGENRGNRGKIVTLLGCKQSIWGQTAGDIVRVVRETGVKYVLYVGKVGALTAEYAPNKWIATGGETMVEGRPVYWDNPLQEFANRSQRIASGAHITVSSPLCETVDWLKQQSEKYAWVDCETGYIADAAKSGDIRFGYLHIVSDSLKHTGEQNLSNEDCVEVDTEREDLYRDIERILTAFLDSLSEDQNTGS
ncbi:hypothetical protein F5884DRAFT_494315 [Xylogone sp. PMI_703]|nr:hypothetical protein F5884DRAFT_494315 [Xylogone sp. PMI_703]